MNAYSKDLRVRVLAAVERGTPREEGERMEAPDAVDESGRGLSGPK